MALAQYQKWYHTNFGRETVGGNFVTSRHYKVTHSDNKRSLFVQITIKSSSNTDSSDVISCLFRTTLGGLTTVMWRSYCSQKRHLFQTQRGPNWNLKPIFGLMLVQLPLENEKLTAVVNLKKLASNHIWYIDDEKWASKLPSLHAWWLLPKNERGAPPMNSRYVKLALGDFR